MSEQQAIDDMPVIMEHHHASTANEDTSRLGVGSDIVGGVAGVIFVVVLAWLVLTMAGVLG